MHTATPADIGKCLLNRATAGEEVIGDVIMVMVKDGLPVVGEDDHLITPCAEQVLIFRFPLQLEFAKPAIAVVFFILQYCKHTSASTTFHRCIFSRHGFRFNGITFLFLLNNF
jgi:hypothetical protein